MIYDIFHKTFANYYKNYDKDVPLIIFPLVQTPETHPSEEILSDPCPASDNQVKEDRTDETNC